jgi:hypothetical protein
MCLKWPAKFSLRWSEAFSFGGIFAHLFSLMALEPNAPGLLGHYRLAKRIT